MELSEAGRIVAGTSHMGSVIPLPRRAMRAAFEQLNGLVDAGIHAFDLAASYQAGGTERMFGKWLAEHPGLRDRLFLISKGGHPTPVVAPHRLSRAALTSDLDGSLKRLGVDALDLYLLHRDSDREPLERIVETMAGFVRAGKIAAWGVSNWTVDRIARARELAAQAGAPIAASSPHVSLFAWATPPYSGSVSIAHDAKAQAKYREWAMPVFAWAPLSNGYMGGQSAFANKHFDNAANRARRKAAQTLAQRRGCTPNQIALAYLCHIGLELRPVVGSRSMKHMRENLAAVELALTSDELAALAPEQMEDE